MLFKLLFEINRKNFVKFQCLFEYFLSYYIVFNKGKFLIINRVCHRNSSFRENTGKKNFEIQKFNFEIKRFISNHFIFNETKFIYFETK